MYMCTCVYVLGYAFGSIMIIYFATLQIRCCYSHC